MSMISCRDSCQGMGSFDSAVKGGDYGMGNAFELCPLAVMTHLADMEATYLVEGKSTE